MPMKKKSSKTFKQSRNWCFTTFKEVEFVNIYNKYTDIIRYICVGDEICPKTKNKHYQGWVQFVNKKTMGGVKRIFSDKSMHLEPCRGSEFDNDKYCKKDNNFIQHGKFIIQGQRTDLEEIKNKIDNLEPMINIANDYFSDYIRYHNGFDKYRALVAKEKTKKFRKVNITVVHGSTGKGKTRFAMKNSKFKITGHQLGQNWWDGYDLEESICIDEFANQIPITNMLNILDGYHLKLPIKGSFTYANWTNVIITSNINPMDWYPNAYNKHREALLRRINKIIDFDLYNSAKVT